MSHPRLNAGLKETKVKLLALVGGSLLSVISSTALYAAPHGPDHPRFPINLGDLEAKAEQRFAAADENANQQIELEEFLNAPAPQRRAGKPRHGGQRFGKHGGKHAMRGGQDAQARKAEMREAVQAEAFKLLDTDNSGDVSAAEFDQADHRAIRQEARKRAMFARLDADDSGSLSLSEMPSRVERLRNMDTDNDGQVTRQEFRAARQARSG